MFCVNCGIKFEGKFCPECGTKVGESIEKGVQSIKELEILRNARDCLMKFEKSNIRLELVAAQREYLNSLVESIKEDIRQKHINDEKIKEIKQKEEKIKAIKERIKEKQKEAEQETEELEEEKDLIEEKKQEMKQQIEAGPKKRISLIKALIAYMTMGISLLFIGISKVDERSHTMELEKVKKEIDELEESIAEKEKNMQSLYNAIMDLDKNIKSIRRDIKNMKNTTGKLDIDTEKLEKKISLLEMYYSKCEEQVFVIFKEAKNVLKSDKWREVKAVINPNYLDLDSIMSLIGYLTYGRASTWKEACNLLEDERYKEAMLQVNIAQLSVQQQMVEAQNELINLAVESIKLQEIGVSLQAESNNLQENSVDLQIENIKLQAKSVGLQMKEIDLQSQNIQIQKKYLMNAYQTNHFLSKQLEEMKKIRRDTRKTQKSAKTIAFINALDLMTPNAIYIRK